MEEKEGVKFIDQEKFQNPPLYRLKFFIEYSKEDLVIQVSQRLSTEDLLSLLSNILDLSMNKIRLKHMGRSVIKEPLEYLNSKLCIKVLGYKRIDIEVEEPLLTPKQSPRYLLTNSPSLLKKLLHIVSSPSIEIANEGWSFVVSLPKNEELVKKLTALDFDPTLGDDQNWEDYLRIKTENQALIAYSLHTLLQLITEKKEVEYINKLNEKHCPLFIYKLLNAISGKEYTGISIKCANYCLKILLSIWNNGIMNTILRAEGHDKFWETITSIIRWILTNPSSIGLNEIPDTLDTCTTMIFNNQDIFNDLIISDTYLGLLQLGISLFSV